MRWLINYIRSCFCKHEWEIIFNNEVDVTNSWGKVEATYACKVYRCKKCGYSKKYKSH